MGTFVFKVTLNDIWRRIAISAGATLDSLAAAILHSVRFDFDHLYEFVYRDPFGATVRAEHPASEGELPAGSSGCGADHAEPE